MSKQEILYTAKNLDSLADFIDLNIEQRQLYMEHVRSDGNGNDIDFISLDNCGPCGCSLGWSPFHPDMPTEKWMFCDGKLFVYKYFLHYYPGMNEWRTLDRKAFGATQSSVKASAIERLRYVATELRAIAS